MLLTDFEVLRPPHETAQQATLDWLLQAHTEAEKTLGNPDLSTFHAQLSERLARVGCKPESIAKRGHVLKDFLHQNWDQMQIYQLNRFPSGRDLSARSELFEHHTDLIFDQFYPDSQNPPDDLIHVSCTGYVAPSAAQKLAAKKAWRHRTTVTHAYHMGCYGSIPACRMAQGFLAADSDKQRVDIVHTEICSLHSNPANHKSDQLVSQSLFADGFIKYSAVQKTERPHFRLLATLEEIIPDSTHAMTWNVAHWGFEMTLAKEVPLLIARALPAYLKQLALKAKRPLEHALFAIHPGGPKILHQISDLLHLTPQQLESSFSILKNYGNMSSATLPHIWEAMLKNPNVPSKTPIVSLAFGPGLSIAGAVMEKVCGS